MTEAPPSPSSGASTTFRRWFSSLAGAMAPLSFLLLLSLILWRMTPNFASVGNMQNIAIQSAAVCILACGQTIVIISGNIDLSVGATMAFCAVAVAILFHGHSVSPAEIVVVSCGIGLLIGVANGLITAISSIPAFIVTLGALSIIHGAAGVISGSLDRSIPAGLGKFANGQLFETNTSYGIPYPVIVVIVTAVAIHILLSRTTWGRKVYALGSNAEAIRLSGINTKVVTVGVFAMAGLLSGLAGVISMAHAGIASKDAGQGMELYSIAATVLGGASLFGGQGGVPGSIIGALLIFTIHNGCELLNYSPELQEMVIGIVIIAAVLYDRYGPGKQNYAKR